MSCVVSGPCTPARDRAAIEIAAREAFSKWGDTALSLDSFRLENPDGLFAPVSRLNALRRELTSSVESALEARRTQRIERVLAEACPPKQKVARRADGFRWSIKIDQIGFVDAFEPADWLGVDELIVDIARDHPTLLVEKLEQLATTIGRERIRLALPALTRKWEDNGIRHKIERLRAAGWTKWEAANLSAWSFLGIDPTTPSTTLDIATDWSVYVINRMAARQLLHMGVSRFALSPEDGLENVTTLLAEFGSRAVLIVHQDTPLFVAESCAYANLIGGCPGKANCKFESMEMESSHGERVTALDYHCRTIVLNQGAFCLSPRLGELAARGAMALRADFIYRNYAPDVVRQRWRLVRAGKAIPGGHSANFEKGML